MPSATRLESSASLPTRPSWGKSGRVLAVVLKHVFSAPTKPFDAVNRRFAVPLLGFLAIGILSALPVQAPSHVRLVTNPAASGGWLTRLNTWRGNTNVSTLSENAVWSQGDYNHALYMVKNDLVTHYETPGVPYYTPEGDIAAQNSNIFVSSSTSTTDEQAIDWWMQAPFHALALMDPRLSVTGFGSYREVKSGWQLGAAVDTLRGNSFSGGSYPVYFPGNGATEPMTTYGGGEFPNPLQACPGYSAPTGMPASIQVGGNSVTVVGAHSFTGNGVALNHCVIDSTNSALSSYLFPRGGVILIPQQPLQSGVKYMVALTVNGLPYTWSFTVGSFSGCIWTTVSSAPPAQSVAGSKVTFTASAPSCANPLYQFWTLAPGASSWTLAQAYSTSASFTWDTVGKAAGTYGVSVWARDATSTGLFGNSAGRWDSYSSSQYVLTAASSASCTGLSVSSAPSSTTSAGTPVTFSAAGSCPHPNPVYEFWILAPGAGSWTVGLAYSTAASFVWSTTGKAAGTYGLSVWVRDASSAGTSSNSSGSWDAYSSSQYVLTASTSAPCTRLTVSSTPPSTTSVGTSVSFTASGTCPHLNPVYQFWTLAPGAGSWTLAQAYSTSATMAWSTAGKAAGTYGLSVWVRDASSAGVYSNGSGSWDVYNSSTYTLTTRACTAVSVSSAPSTMGGSPAVTFTATGTCPDASPVYEFWVLAPGASSWTLGQAYSTNATFVWSASGKVAGTYHLSVWVRDASSSGVYGNSSGTWDAYNSSQYTL